MSEPPESAVTSEFDGYPRLQDSPEFYRRALDHLPTPVIVISPAGEIVYVNEAIIELTGWTVYEAIGDSLFEYLHPDDAPWILQAFTDLVESGSTDPPFAANRMGAMRVRVLAKDGRVIPIEATGGVGLTDPAIGGLMYSVRPARIEELLDSVFAGVAEGESIESLMQLVVDIVTLPPLGIEAAVFEQRSDGSDRLVATSDPCLEGLPVNCTDFVPWAGLCTEATAVEIDTLPEAARDQLVGAGFERCIHAGAHAPDVSTTLRLIACMRERRDPVIGAVQRVERARELMSVVLLKAHNDRLLARAATIDDLTGLPNRIGLSRHLEQVASSSDDCVMLFVDIDEFKLVNDRHGHLVGDRVLATVADRLRRAVRADDVVTRLYGDEFIVLLKGMSGDLTPDTVERIAERVVSMLAAPLKIDGVTLNISASVGVAHLGEDRDIDRLMGCADQAMYAAKRAGGGRHHIDAA